FDDRAFDDFTFRDVAEAGIVKLEQVGELLRIHVAAALLRERRDAAMGPRTSLQNLHFLSRVVTHRVSGPPHCPQGSPTNSCRISFGGLLSMPPAMKTISTELSDT